MNFKSVFHVIAWLLGIVGLLMGCCSLFSYLYGDPAMAWMSLGYSSAGTLLFGALLWTLTQNKRVLSRRDGMGVVAFGWLFAGIAGAAPYYLAGIAPTPLAALFESVSGMTTTGATLLSGLEQIPKGLLLWRSLTQFIGGMGVLILVVAILPFAGAGGMQLFRAEMPGPTKDRIEPRVTSTAKMLWGVYMLLTLALMGLLWLGGMSGFDAVCHSLTTMATGGFSTQSNSIAAYHSLYIECVLIVFMLLAGINFSLHYRVLRGEFSSWWKNSEVRFFIAVFAVFSLVATVFLHQARATAGGGWGSAFREVSFTCASIMTTTGYTTGDYEQWPVLGKALLILLMFMGGCAGSTAGAIKAGRVQVMLKAVFREVRLFMQPKAVIPVRMGRKFLSDEILLGIVSFVALYLFVMLMGVLVMIPITVNIQTAVSSVITCMGNVGPGFAAVGPTCNYASIPEAGKAILTLLMLVGRLELFTMLAILMPAFWRK